jgi:hypothetical protein
MPFAASICLTFSDWYHKQMVNLIHFLGGGGEVRWSTCLYCSSEVSDSFSCLFHLKKGRVLAHSLPSGFAPSPEANRRVDGEEEGQFFG